MNAVERSSDVSERQIVLSRTYDAPRELVFAAWTERQHLEKWFGPNGFTMTTHAIDVRPGGEWRFMFHGPDGRDYPNVVVYREITPPSRLSLLHSDDTGSIQFEVEVTFEEVARNKTRVTLTQTHPSVEARDYVVREFGAIEGGKQTLERLAQHLPTMREFSISRTFDAPRELVFRTWTDPEHLKHWWGPKGMTVAHCTNDLRPGGLMHYLLKGPGIEMWGKWVYREVVPPERLEFLSSFSDAEGNTTKAPFEEEWPREMLAFITFEENAGKTTVTVRWSPYNANEEETATFNRNHASMRGGWGGTFEQYDAYLGSIR